MKTLTKNQISLYLFEDDEVLNPTPTSIIVGDPIKFTVADCNSENTILHEEVTAPSDWFGGKYLFDGTDWTLNPNWVEPE